MFCLVTDCIFVFISSVLKYRHPTTLYSILTGNVQDNFWYYIKLPMLIPHATCLKYQTQLDPHNGMAPPLLQLITGQEINTLTTVGYLLEVFIKLWTPSMVCIFTSAWSQHWKLVKASLTHSLWVRDLGHTHSLACIQQSGPSNQRMLLWTKNCLNTRNGVPTR